MNVKYYRPLILKLISLIKHITITFNVLQIKECNLQDK